jgi:type I restriction enzyme, S subunit
MLKGGGSTDPAKQPDEQFVLYSIPAFDGGAPEIVKGSEIGSPKKNVETGDILLSRIVPHIRRSWIVGRHGNEKLVASGEWIVFRSPKIHGPYLRNFLVSDTFHPQFMGTVAGVGGSLLRANPNRVANITIPLPPLDEQRRIAAILDKADALRRKYRRVLDLLDGLARSIFRKTFVEQHSDKWSKHSVASLARNMRTGPFGSQLLHSEFVDDGIAVLGIDNAVANEFRWGERRYISREKYEQLRRYTVSPGDVLITIMGTCGRCAIVPEDVPVAINTKHLCCITLDSGKCLPEFLQAAFLQHPDVLQQLGVQAKGAVMPGLNMGIVKSLSIYLPPIDVQRTFATEVSKLKAILISSRAAERKADDVFSSLQARAFSGQL